MGYWGYWNLIESVGLGMRNALKRRALKMMERFFLRNGWAIGCWNLVLIVLLVFLLRLGDGAAMHEPLLDASCNRSIARANDPGGDMGDFGMDDFAMSHVQF